MRSDQLSYAPGIAHGIIHERSGLCKLFQKFYNFRARAGSGAAISATRSMKARISMKACYSRRIWFVDRLEHACALAGLAQVDLRLPSGSGLIPLA